MVYDLTTQARAETAIKVGGAPMASATTGFADELIAFYSAQAEGYLGRTVTTATYTEYFDVKPYRARFSLKAYPITTISQVTNDGTRAYTTGDIDSDDYTHDPDTGVLSIDGTGLVTGVRALRVIYLGGMGTGTSTFVTSYPDIAGAIDMQVAYHFSRRSSLGRTAESMGPGSVSYQGAMDWLPHVKTVLDRHRRLHFG
jgi:hypothetical protein